MKVRKRLSEAKVWVTRIQTYLALFNFTMIMYLYIIEEPMNIPYQYWIVIILIGICAVLFFDIKYIFSSELHYKFKCNPGMKNILERLKRIEEKIDKRE
mgnify:CR=1 FL=1